MLILTFLPTKSKMSSGGYPLGSPTLTASMSRVSVVPSGILTLATTDFPSYRKTKWRSLSHVLVNMWYGWNKRRGNVVEHICTGKGSTSLHLVETRLYFQLPLLYHAAACSGVQAQHHPLKWDCINNALSTRMALSRILDQYTYQRNATTVIGQWTKANFHSR